eukprot:INCI17824.1.p1 GENE.INCI17824.1~~INCI17824.1.p1  ORF type:complete len:345 (-),score=34.84 INCI17824.1:682-1716(-)
MNEQSSEPSSGPLADSVGGGGEEKSSHHLVRVLAKWLQLRSPVAIACLASSLCPARAADTPGATSDDGTLNNTTIRLRIETAAGVPLCVVDSPSLDPTIASLSAVVASLLETDDDDHTFAASNQMLFLQGSDERLNPHSTLRDNGIVGSCSLVIMVCTNNKWSRVKSSDVLVISDDETEIMRPSSHGIFPCGRTENLLKQPGDGFQVRIKALFSVPNALAIGVLSAGFRFPKSSTIKVGLTNGTMGVHIDHVEDYMTCQDNPLLPAVAFAAPGLGKVQMLGQPIRMFESGDRLHFCIRATDGNLFLDIKLNGVLFCEEPIPPTFRFPFQPACNLPDDCCLVLEL